MKVLRVISLIIGYQLLIGCTQPQSSLPSQSTLWYKWTCDSGLIIDWSYQDSSQKSIQVYLDQNPKLYILDKVYTTNKGTLYSKGDIALRIQDQEAIAFWARNDEIIGKHCSTSTVITDQ